MTKKRKVTQPLAIGVLLAAGPFFVPLLVIVITGTDHAYAKVGVSWLLVGALYMLLRKRPASAGK